MEKFPRYRGENSKYSDFAATIISQFAGADTQNAFTSGDFRPTQRTLDEVISMVGNGTLVIRSAEFIGLVR